MILALLALGTVITAASPTPSPAPGCSAIIAPIERGATSPKPKATCLPADLTLQDRSTRVPSELRLVMASPTPAPVCDREALPAPAVPPAYPDASLKRNLGNVSVDVLVHVSATGAVTRAQVTHSSGDPDIDSAALDAALRTTYSPKIVKCEAVPGTYIFRADFSRDG